MPTISLSLPSLLNSPISSFFLPTTTTTITTTTTTTTTTTPTTSNDESPPLDSPQKKLPKPMGAVELRRVFDMFDQNGDGRITMSELRDSLINMGIFIPDNDLSQMIANIDVNGDGCVDGDEFQALYDVIMERSHDGNGDDESEEEDMKDAFSVFDKNGDGFISVDELGSVLGSLGLNQGKNLEDCKLMIMKVDVDGDGMVSFKEFKKMMKQGGFVNLK